MRLLAFDTSGAALSAAAAEDDDLRAWLHEPLERGHAERLLPMLRRVMGETGWSWADLDMVAVTIGPGQFTGLRAGIAVARALALALKLPVAGIGTLEVVAEAAAGRRPDLELPIAVALDARRDEAYHQLFAADLRPLGPPALLPLRELRGEGRCLLAGDAGLWMRAMVDRDDPVVEAAPDARYLAAMARRRCREGDVPTVATAPRPVYLRPPDARIGAGASLVAATS